MNSGLYATVAIGAEEARSGTQRILTLPDGKSVTVAIPPGVTEGYLLYLDGQGNTHNRHDQVGTPLLTVIVHIEAGARPVDIEHDQATVRGVFYTPPTPPRADSVPPALEPTKLSLPYGGQSNSEPIYGGIMPPPPPSYPQPSQPYPQPLPSYPQPSSLFPASSPGRSRKLVLSLVGVGLVVIVIAIISLGAYQSHVNQVSATATAQANVTVTARANATATTTAQVHDTAVAIAAATASVVAANPYPSYLPGSGKLALHDPLAKPAAWTESSDATFGGSCQFTGGAYQVSVVKANRYYECTTNSLTFSDFTFQVQMTLKQGDCGGMTFRDNNAGKHYRFLVCRDNSYALELDRDLSGNHNTTLSQGSLSNTTVQNQSISLVVQAKGASINIYCNGQRVVNVTDSSYSSGELGLLAANLGINTNVAYSNARVWTF